MGIRVSSVLAWLKRALEILDAWLYPEHIACLCCDHALGETDVLLCSACTAALQKLAEQQIENNLAKTEQIPDNLSGCIAAFPYTAQARQLVIQLKFNGQREAALPLAEAMADLSLPHTDLLVPVPTTERRIKDRGYNQAALLAHHVSKQTGLPFANALVRTDRHASQVHLSAKMRRRNLIGCMRAQQDVRGLSVLIVDDVFTTGSTAGEAARALLDAGAKSVFALTAARTLPASAEQNLPFFDLPFKKHGQNASKFV